jgi:hypothetical protein
MMKRRAFLGSMLALIAAPRDWVATHEPMPIPRRHIPRNVQQLASNECCAEIVRSGERVSVLDPVITSEAGVVFPRTYSDFVVSAHLATLFPIGEDVRLRKNGVTVHRGRVTSYDVDVPSCRVIVGDVEWLLEGRADYHLHCYS